MGGMPMGGMGDMFSSDSEGNMPDWLQAHIDKMKAENFEKMRRELKDQYGEDAEFAEVKQDVDLKTENNPNAETLQNAMDQAKAVGDDTQAQGKINEEVTPEVSTEEETVE